MKVGTGVQTFTASQGADGAPVTVSVGKDCGSVVMPNTTFYQLAGDGTIAKFVGDNVVFKHKRGFVIVIQ